MNEATIQMAYSLTKAITGIAVMQLAERGQIELDAPLQRYYQRHPYGDGVTIRQLLSHTSGVPAPMPLDWFALQGEPFDGDQQLQRLLAQHPRLRHAPGQEYGYTDGDGTLDAEDTDGDGTADSTCNPCGEPPSCRLCPSSD